MGLKGLMSGMGMNVFASVALILFFAAFVAIVLWTWTRPKEEIEAQSRLWEDEEERAAGSPPPEGTPTGARHA